MAYKITKSCACGRKYAYVSDWEDPGCCVVCDVPEDDSDDD